ncbi:conserved hypothetical protein [Novosphingobium sp. 9U]|nr:conserved hypothetical protein [Novosphingobium sp. 9U]
MMKLVIPRFTATSSHRLHTLAITGTDQNRNVGRAHPTTDLVSKAAYNRLKPTLEIRSPIRIHHQPFQKLALYELPHPLLGNPRNQTSAKIVLGPSLEAQVHLVWSGSHWTDSTPSIGSPGRFPHLSGPLRRIVAFGRQ